MVLMAVNPIVVQWINLNNSTNSTEIDGPYPGLNGWFNVNVVDTNRGPKFQGSTHNYSWRYTKKNWEVEVYIYQYGRQTQGAELINSENIFYESGAWWRTANFEHILML